MPVFSIPCPAICRNLIDAGFAIGQSLLEFICNEQSDFFRLLDVGFLLGGRLVLEGVEDGLHGGW